MSVPQTSLGRDVDAPTLSPPVRSVERALEVGPARAAPRGRPRPRRGVLADLRTVARDYMNSRDLLVQLTLRDIRVRYKQAALGFAWALLIPLTIILAGLAVRFAIAFASGYPVDRTQLAGIAVKSLPWAFFVGCINTTTPSLIGNVSLVTKIYFPREVLPLSGVLAQTFDSCIGATLLAVALPLLGVEATLQLLWVPPLLVLLWTLAAATGLLLSCANLFFRDVKYLVQVFLSFGIFFTPVLVDASMFGPKFGPLVMLNPIAPILEGLRLAIVQHHDLALPLLARPGFAIWHPWYLVYSATWALGGLVVATLFFHRAEKRFAEIV